MKHRASAMALAAAGLLASLASARAGTIIEDWAKVQPPEAPALKSVTLDPKTTALLVMDLLEANCGAKARPRCYGTVAPIADFVKRAEAAHVRVLYTVFPGRTAADFLPALKPGENDKVFTGPADKFRDPDLEKTLRADGIKTVIAVGSAANGAVLYTASEAALRGYAVVVPVDGLSADPPYAEQSAVWTLAHAPTVSQHVTLTRFSDIKF